MKEELKKVMSETKIATRRKKAEKEAEARLSVDEIIRQATEKYEKAERKDQEIQKKMAEAEYMNAVAKAAAKETVEAKNKFLADVQYCSQRTEELNSKLTEALKRESMVIKQAQDALAAKKKVAKERDVAIASLIAIILWACIRPEIYKGCTKTLSLKSPLTTIKDMMRRE